MLLLLIQKTLSFLSDYSLLAPFKTTSYNEIGLWTLRGSCIPQKRFLKFTSLANESGGACLRAPTNFADWEVEYAFKDIPFNSSRTNSFVFSEKLCPDSSVLTPGVMVKTVEHINSTNISFYVSLKTNTNLTHNKFIGSFDSTRYENHNRIKIQYINDVLSIFIGNKFYDEVFSTQINLSDGYFSIFSRMNEAVRTNNLLYFVVHNHSEINKNAHQKDVLDANRKVLRKSKYHYFNREIRRLHMIKTMKYFEEEQLKNGNVSNIDKIKFHDSLLEIKEAINRAALGVTAKELNEYAMDIATFLLEKTSRMYDQVSNDVNEISEALSILYSQVFDFIREQQLNVEQFKREIMNSVSDLEMLFKTTQNEIKETESNGYYSMFERMLWPIAVAEFISYIIFFIAKYKFTNGFKKRD